PGLARGLRVRNRPLRLRAASPTHCVERDQVRHEVAHGVTQNALADRILPVPKPQNTIGRFYSVGLARTSRRHSVVETPNGSRSGAGTSQKLCDDPDCLTRIAIQADLSVNDLAVGIEKRDDVRVGKL